MFNEQRKRLIETYIKPAGVTDERVLRAFNLVPRHEFVLPENKDEAYLDIPLPIGEGQTISQPSLVALMTQALQLNGNEKVLEIGTGSGYQAAILSLLVKKVYTVERIESLAERAKHLLEQLGYKNVTVVIGNGTAGLPQFSPFDAIIVTAAADEIPKPLIEQLKEGGRIIIPVGERFGDQTLKLGAKKQGKLQVVDLEAVRFVPLIGKFGWEEKSS